MRDKKKYGWTVKGIIGAVFLPMGLVYLFVSVMIRQFAFQSVNGDPDVLLYVFGGIGLVFAVLGLVFLYLDLRRRALLRRAYEGGHYVMAKIIGVTRQNNVRINHSSPYVIECSWAEPERDIVHIYTSRYLFTDVTQLLKSDEVPVYIDRMNEDIGFVDIDAVLPEIRRH